MAMLVCRSVDVFRFMYVYILQDHTVQPRTHETHDSTTPMKRRYRLKRTGFLS